jgi:hypothetical protein
MNEEGSHIDLMSGTFPVICVEGLRKPTKSLRQNSQFPDRDTNRPPPECESEALYYIRYSLVMNYKIYSSKVPVGVFVNTFRNGFELHLILTN